MAGFAYASYGQLKMASIVEDIVYTLRRAFTGPKALYAERLRDAIREDLRRTGLDRLSAKGGGASDEAIAFFREHDLGFRIRRLRFLARRLGEEIAQVGAHAACRPSSRCTTRCTPACRNISTARPPTCWARVLQILPHPR